jgi:hypothetical protein
MMATLTTKRIALLLKVGARCQCWLMGTFPAHFEEWAGLSTERGPYMMYNKKKRGSDGGHGGRLSDSSRHHTPTSV